MDVNTRNPLLFRQQLKEQAKQRQEQRQQRVAVGRHMQQISSVLATREFLRRLTEPSETPKVPLDLRREALALLRHYPKEAELAPILERELPKLRAHSMADRGTQTQPATQAPSGCSLT